MTVRSMTRFARRNRTTMAIALTAVLASTGSAAAASYLVLSTSNTATTTTTLKSAVNGAVLSLQNKNTTGGTSARGLSITVPAGRPPIVVNSTAGKATNLNADRLDGIDSTGFVRGPVEAWHEVGATGQPGFTSTPGAPSYTWANIGDGFNTAGFYKDPLGIVHLKGLIRILAASTVTVGCSDAKVFTLPAGYRPAARTISQTVAKDAFARVDVLATGEVALCNPFVWQPKDYLSLDGIEFRAGG
jgi:hypothetical protein